MLVSVLITTYDYGAFLAAAVSSVARQEYGPIELVVVDDGSRDGTARVLADARTLHAGRFERFEIVRFPANRGRLSALNRGIPLLRGAVTVLLDADDRLDPAYVGETVSTLRAAHARDRRVAFVYTDCWLVERNGNRLARGMSAEYDEELLRRASYIPGCAATFTSAWRDVLPFDDRRRVGEKHYRWRKVAASGRRGVHLPKPLFHYRMHDRNASGIGSKVARACAAGERTIPLLSGYWPSASRAGAAAG